MAPCAAGTVLPELTFRRIVGRAQWLRELGERPATVPAFYEYKLKA
jgi:hypothetical protein